MQQTIESWDINEVTRTLERIKMTRSPSGSTHGSTSTSDRSTAVSTTSAVSNASILSIIDDITETTKTNTDLPAINNSVTKESKDSSAPQTSTITLTPCSQKTESDSPGLGPSSEIAPNSSCGNSASESLHLSPCSTFSGSIGIHMIQESREIYETPSPTKEHVSHLPSDFSIASSSRATSTLKLALEDSPPQWLDESSQEPLSPRTLGKMSMANRLKYSDSVSIDDCSKWEKEKKMKHEIRKSITSTLVGQFSTPKLIERLSKSALHTVQAPPLLPSQAQHILYWNDMSQGTENVVCCASKTMNDDYKSGLIHMT